MFHLNQLTRNRTQQNPNIEPRIEPIPLVAIQSKIFLHARHKRVGNVGLVELFDEICQTHVGEEKGVEFADVAPFLGGAVEGVPYDAYDAAPAGVGWCRGRRRGSLLFDFGGELWCLFFGCCGDVDGDWSGLFVEPHDGWWLCNV